MGGERDKPDGSGGDSEASLPVLQRAPWTVDNKDQLAAHERLKKLPRWRTNGFRGIDDGPGRKPPGVLPMWRKVFEAITYPMSVNDICEAIGVSKTQVRECVRKLRESGEIINITKGNYTAVYIQAKSGEDG